MSKLNIRLARAGDGATIERLLRASGWLVDGIDWSDVGANWLLAEWEGKPVACLEVLPGKPIGRIDMMGTDPDMTPRVRGIVARDIIAQGCATLRVFGSQIASGTVPFELKSYRKVAGRRGWAVATEGVFLLKRL